MIINEMAKRKPIKLRRLALRQIMVTLGRKKPLLDGFCVTNLANVLPL